MGGSLESVDVGLIFADWRRLSADERNPSESKFPVVENPLSCSQRKS